MEKVIFFPHMLNWIRRKYKGKVDKHGENLSNFIYTYIICIYYCALMLFYCDDDDD